MNEQELQAIIEGLNLKILDLGSNIRDLEALQDLLSRAVEALEGITPEDPPDDPPPPPPPPKPTRSVFGWNLGGAVYWDGARPFHNHAPMAIVNVNAGAKLDRYGYLEDGYGQAWIDLEKLAPGRYDAYGSELDVQPDSSGTVGVKIEPNRDHVMLRRGDDLNGITPTFVDRYRNASCIRLMDALATVITDDKHRDGCYYRAWPVTRAGNKELRLQRMIQTGEAVRLSKAAGGLAIWWNIHHLDSDAWIRQQMNDLRNSMMINEHWTNVIIEDSNERWNPPFPAWASAVSRGIAGQQDFEAHARHHAQRTRHIGNIARDVLGEENVVVAISAQNANVNWAKKVMGFGPECDMIAVSAYWGNLHENEYNGNWSVGDLLSHANIYWRTVTTSRVRQHMELAQQHAVRLGAYEGGVHFQLESRQQPYELNIRAALSHPEMGEHYREFGSWWKGNVNDILCWYNDVSVKPFGAKRLEHDPDDTSRMSAILELMA